MPQPVPQAKSRLRASVCTTCRKVSLYSDGTSPRAVHTCTPWQHMTAGARAERVKILAWLDDQRRQGKILPGQTAPRAS